MSYSEYVTPMRVPVVQEVLLVRKFPSEELRLVPDLSISSHFFLQVKSLSKTGHNLVFIFDLFNLKFIWNSSINLSFKYNKEYHQSKNYNQSNPIQSKSHNLLPFLNNQILNVLGYPHSFNFSFLIF